MFVAISFLGSFVEFSGLVVVDKKNLVLVSVFKSLCSLR